MRFWQTLCLVTVGIVGGLQAVTHAMPAWSLAAKERAWGAGKSIVAGDVVLQDLECGTRCDLIRAVTHSNYAHTGIVLDEGGGKLVVWEAYGPVAAVALDEWVQRGVGQRVAVYRWRDDLAAQLPAIAFEVRRLQGTPYDGDYQWDDHKIYCSELIAKAVNRAVGRAIFLPRVVRGGFAEYAESIARLTNGKLTEDTQVVSPADLARSPALVRIVDELENVQTTWSQR